MKKLIYFFVLILGITSCSSDDEYLREEFKFSSEYSARVTVGGVVGITERTFEVGEIYKGTDTGGSTIQTEIAEHSRVNDDCPNPKCYQEFLEVPREFLKLVD